VNFTSSRTRLFPPFLKLKINAAYKFSEQTSPRHFLLIFMGGEWGERGLAGHGKGGLGGAREGVEMLGVCEREKRRSHLYFALFL
jgi:hypothetical protein